MRINSVSQTSNYNNKANKNQAQKFGAMTPETIKFAEEMAVKPFEHSTVALFKESWLHRLIDRASANTTVDVCIYPTGGRSGHIGLQAPGGKYITDAEQKYWTPQYKEKFEDTLERFVDLAAEKEHKLMTQGSIER